MILLSSWSACLIDMIWKPHQKIISKGFTPIELPLKEDRRRFRSSTYLINCITSKCVRGGPRSGHVLCLCTAATTALIYACLQNLLVWTVSIFLVGALFHSIANQYREYPHVPLRVHVVLRHRVLIGLLVLGLLPTTACSPIQMRGDRQISCIWRLVHGLISAPYRALRYDLKHCTTSMASVPGLSIWLQLNCFVVRRSVQKLPHFS